MKERENRTISFEGNFAAIVDEVTGTHPPVATRDIADEARDMIEQRFPNSQLNVRVYPCSDGCGPGPRFIVSGDRAKYVPVCFNLDSLREELKRSGDDAAQLLLRAR